MLESYTYGMGPKTIFRQFGPKVKLQPACAIKWPENTFTLPSVLTAMAR
jgi:hypothetical protein